MANASSTSMAVAMMPMNLYPSNDTLPVQVSSLQHQAILSSNSNSVLYSSHYPHPQAGQVHLPTQSTFPHLQQQQHQYPHYHHQHHHQQQQQQQQHQYPHYHHQHHHQQQQQHHHHHQQQPHPSSLSQQQQQGQQQPYPLETQFQQQRIHSQLAPSIQSQHSVNDGPFRIPTVPRNSIGSLGSEAHHAVNLVPSEGSERNTTANPSNPLAAATLPSPFRNGELPRTHSFAHFGVSFLPPHQTANPQPQLQQHHHHHHHPHPSIPLAASPSFGSFDLDFVNSPSMSDLANLSAHSTPMMRYGSFDMSSGGIPRPASASSMIQPSIDHLLALSKAQADAIGDSNLFTCPHCDKKYNGKHARSIWRRHLQDKHNIPLSIQPRRTRWDGDANRPKNAEERRSRMLESKRRWARKKRLQEKLAAVAAKNESQGTSSTFTAADMEIDDDVDYDDDEDDDDDGEDADISNTSLVIKSEPLDTLNPESNDCGMMLPSRNNHRSLFSISKPTASNAWNSESNPFISQNPMICPSNRQTLDTKEALVTGGFAAATTTPLHNYNMLYPTPPSVGPYGGPTHMATGTTSISNAPTAANAPSRSLPPLSPPASGERTTAFEYQQQMRAGAADSSFSSNYTSDYSQSNSSALTEGISHDSSQSGSTSVSTPTSATMPCSLAIADPSSPKPLAQAQPMRKHEQQEAAIQLLALRSNSNSPADSSISHSSRKRGAEAIDGPWDTPSKTRGCHTSGGSPRNPRSARSDHASLTALSRPGPSPRSLSSTSIPFVPSSSSLLQGADIDLQLATKHGARRCSEPRETPSKSKHSPSIPPSSPSPPSSSTLAINKPILMAGLHDGSPTPAPRSQPSFVAVAAAKMAGPLPSPIAAASSSSMLLNLSTPGPLGLRATENPFSLDKHKISPFEGKRKLNYATSTPSAMRTFVRSAGGERVVALDAFGSELTGSPIGSPSSFGPISLPMIGGSSQGKESSTANDATTAASNDSGATMEKSASLTSTRSDGLMGPRLPPLLSTPIRPVDSLSAMRGTIKRVSEGNGEHDDDGNSSGDTKLVLPQLLSTSKRSLVTTPFSKTPAGSGFSALRGGGGGSGNIASVRRGGIGIGLGGSPSKLGCDQFSSPQHLNLTESLGLAPHSAGRGSLYASLYGTSLGLTPSLTNLTPGGVGDVGDVGGSGMGGNGSGGGGLGASFNSAFNTPFLWPDSTRKLHPFGVDEDEDDDDDDESGNVFAPGLLHRQRVSHDDIENLNPATTNAINHHRNNTTAASSSTATLAGNTTTSRRTLLSMRNDETPSKPSSTARRVHPVGVVSTLGSSSKPNATKTSGSNGNGMVIQPLQLSFSAHTNRSNPTM